jgi:triacylglycerol lipase
MSLFTQMPIERYAADAVAGFGNTAAFDLGVARSLAWMSQLAYETNTAKIREICGKWQISLAGDPIHRSVSTGLPIASTYALVLDLGEAMVVSFAGTDPVLLANWVSDFDIRPTEGGAAKGFSVAVQAVEKDILTQLPTDRPVMLTGHSLGGALAVLLAQNLVMMRREVTAVYTFGMPRPGRRDFSDSYNQGPLAARTYRFVHGDDIVPTVTPSKPLGFRHVGRLVSAPTGGKFTVPSEAVDSDQPAFAKGIAGELSEILHHPLAVAGAVGHQLRNAVKALSGRVPAGMRTDLAGITIEMLPPRIRHHLPDQYIAACS